MWLEMIKRYSVREFCEASLGILPALMRKWVLHFMAVLQGEYEADEIYRIRIFPLLMGY